jgi:hypothetical protein
MAAGMVNRSTKRSYTVAFRLSREDRALLRQRATAAGLSVQAYLERVALDRPNVRDLPPGPVRDFQELPLDKSA